MSDEMFQGTSIDLDEVAGINTAVPGDQRYVAELVAATGVAASKSSGKPMVHAIFEIRDGEYEGMELNKYYSMGIKASKKPGGRPWAPGLAELRGDLKSIGQALRTGFQFPVKDGYGDQEKAAAILGKAFRGKKVEIFNALEARKNKATGEVERDEAGNVRYSTRPRIIRVAGGSVLPVDDKEDLGL